MRMNISVPDTLKQRMDSLPDEHKPNWSALAVRAFENYLAELATKRKADDMESVIDRLRASAREEDDQDTKAGRDAGQRWAKQSAEAVELRRLETAIDPQLEGGWGFVDSEYSAYHSAEAFVFIIDPDNEGVRGVVGLFWQGQVDEEKYALEYPSSAFVQGFAEGAMEVWQQVKESL